MAHGPMRLKTLVCDQRITQPGELIPSFNEDSEIDLVRCAMDGQVIDTARGSREFY